MRQLLATVLAALAVGLMLAAISLPGAPGATARPLDPAQATATPPMSLCVPEFNKVASPAEVGLGGEVHITLTTKVSCPLAPLHMVLVLPESGGVPAQELERIQDHAEQVVDCLKLADNPLFQVAVVAYAGSARTLCQLTNDPRRVKSCIRQLRNSGITAIDAGIDEGVKTLARGRPGAAGVDPREVMLVYAASGNAAGCGPVLSAANRAKSQKILLMTVCAGDSCDANCLRQAASSPRYFYHTDSPWPCAVEQGWTNSVRRLTITDQLPADMAYVEGSADPAPSSGDPLTGFVWVQNYVPRDGVTITLRVRPLECGERPTNVEASGELLDANNATKRFVFPVPTVKVCPEGSATPTATPSPTASPTATILPMTCTPPACPCGRLVGVCPNVRCEVCTATATPEATRTPVSRSVYLPWSECRR